eukprot:4595704-Pyramimonas_sp.AAC.1
MLPVGLWVGGRCNLGCGIHIIIPGSKEAVPIVGRFVNILVSLHLARKNDREVITHELGTPR